MNRSPRCVDGGERDCGLVRWWQAGYLGAIARARRLGAPMHGQRYIQKRFLVKKIRKVSPVSVILLLLSLTVFRGTLALASDYSEFAALSDAKKDKIVSELHDRDEWGLPEHKPICCDVLKNQGYPFLNAIAWTIAAIDLAQEQNWTDLDPFITRIYGSPRNIWVYERAFRYLRDRAGKPVSSNLVRDVESLRKAGFYRSTISDERLSKAKEALAQNPDREAVLVYVLGVAAWHAGKGGTDRGRLAAVEILQQLPHGDVASRLRQLHRDCEGYMRPEIEWVTGRLGVQLGRNTEPVGGAD